jgi:hypothetical protein
MGTWRSSVELEVTEERDGLKCFTQTLLCQLALHNRGTRLAHHLVGQDTVDTIVMQRSHPIQPLNLVIPHLSALYICHESLA